MWRRLRTPLKALSKARSSTRCIAAGGDTSSSAASSALRLSFHLINRHFTSEFENVVSKKRVEDVVPIATGHESEEIQAELERRRILEIDFPEDPFGTKVIDVLHPGMPNVSKEGQHKYSIRSLWK